MTWLSWELERQQLQLRQPELHQVTADALPFDVNNLAKICQYYRRDNVGEDV